MRIITVSRQFGSGGRELGKRLSDRLGWDYYDKEIIDALADEHGYDPEFVKLSLANHGWHNVQLTYSSSFSHLLYDPGQQVELLTREQEILRSIADLGNDCIIIGRDADVILEDLHPFRVFVCADLQARVDRCMRYERKRPAEEQLTEKEILRNIRRIDHNRRMVREVLTGKTAGDGSSFDLTVNAARWDIKKLAEAVAEFSGRWFEQYEQKY